VFARYYPMTICVCAENGRTQFAPTIPQILPYVTKAKRFPVLIMVD